MARLTDDGRVLVACSWCHAVCDLSDERCAACGHHPTVPRTSCDCGKCTTQASARPCGCDPAANWTCEQHRGQPVRS